MARSDGDATLESSNVDGTHLSSAPSDASHSAAVSFSQAGLLLNPWRRRRLFNLMSLSGPENRDSAARALNPEATEFTPAVTRARSFKRKASAPPSPGESSTTCFRSMLDSRASFSDDMNLDAMGPREPHELPLIKSKDLFEPDQRAAGSMFSYDRRSQAESANGHLQQYEHGLRPYGHTSESALPRIDMLHSDDSTRAEHLSSPELSRSQGSISRSAAADGVSKLSTVLISLPGATESSSSTVTNLQSSNNVRYLPLCSAPERRGQGDLTVLPSYRNRVDNSDAQRPSRVTWPANTLPVELFDIITRHLSRDDAEAMRLVNHEFERKVARTLFHTSVVPFNTELFDMIGKDTQVETRQKVKYRHEDKWNTSDDGEDAVGASHVTTATLQWQNAKEDKEGKVYKGHGLKVFRGFGPYIKRFGMSFEVSEMQLSHPSVKKELDRFDAYHGSYDWPSQQYVRFDDRAGLERAADETSCMKAAFGSLAVVQELALSIDSGLGWLNGSDKSVRSRIFDAPSPVFGRSLGVSSHWSLASARFWEALQESQASFGHGLNSKEILLAYRELDIVPAQLEGLKDSHYVDTRLWPTVDAAIATPDGVCGAWPNNRFGVLYTTPEYVETSASSGSKVVTPNNLRTEQKEWLLETEWAQRAFLESYTLAIIDNPKNFESVTTLRIAKLSSRFISKISAEGFWHALPSLRNVVLHVSPDWRTVDKDEAGCAEITPLYPSEALHSFHKLLRNGVSLVEGIKNLDIGWVGGGEHAEGLFARNNHLLPAPISRLEHSIANSGDCTVIFKHVEHLTLRNCWITPPALEGLVKSHADAKLKQLTLNSVSLTAHPCFSTADGQGAQPAFAAQQMPPLLANTQPQQPQAGNFNGQPWQQIPPALGPQNLNQNNLQAQQLVRLHQNWQAQIQLNAGSPPLRAVLASASNTVPGAHWTASHRVGSWPLVINMISPGLTFSDYAPGLQLQQEQRSPRPTALVSIEFVSCGYARLSNNITFDQLVVEAGVLTGPPASTWFRLRQSALKPAMMETRDHYFGQIIQYMPPRELYALQLAWGLTEGWEEGERAEEAEYDGFLRGGTGRFSGTVEKSQRSASKVQN